MLKKGILPSDENARKHRHIIEKELKDERWTQVIMNSLTTDQQEEFVDLYTKNELDLGGIAAHFNVSRLKLMRMIKNQDGEFTEWFRDAEAFRELNQKSRALVELEAQDAMYMEDEVKRRKLINDLISPNIKEGRQASVEGQVVINMPDYKVAGS